MVNVTKPGAVILFHDGGGNRKQTVKALEEIFSELQKQWTFCATARRTNRVALATR